MVESQVLFRFNIRRFLGPQWFGVVNDVVFVCIDIFAIFPLSDFAEGNRNRQETAVFFQNLVNAITVVELQAVFRKMQNDICSTITFVFWLFQRVFRWSIAAPLHRFAILFPRVGNDLYLVGDHESWVETQSEVTDNVLVFIFG